MPCCIGESWYRSSRFAALLFSVLLFSVKSFKVALSCLFENLRLPGRALASVPTPQRMALHAWRYECRARPAGQDLLLPSGASRDDYPENSALHREPRTM